MPTLYLICGLPGSGKTTLAKEIEREKSALRLTPDEWMHRLFGDGFNEEARLKVETIQWKTAERALKLGMNVVLDFGFWGRAERDGFRAKAAALGAKTELRFLDVALDELKRRLALRNADLPPDTFPVTEKDLDDWSKLFERPSPEELA
jgi:predicted kinase